MKKFSFISLLVPIIFLASCNSSSDTKDTGEVKTDSTSYFDSTAGISIEAAREQQMNFVIEAAKETLDSMDAVYTSVRSSAKLMTLSLNDREQMNATLQQINDTRELIILETQKEILDQLQQKAAAFKMMVSVMRGKSDKLAGITQRLSKLSDMIQKTTDALVSAFSSGIVKPKIDAILKS